MKEKRHTNTNSLTHNTHTDTLKHSHNRFARAPLYKYILCYEKESKNHSLKSNARLHTILVNFYRL